MGKAKEKIKNEMTSDNFGEKKGEKWEVQMVGVQERKGWMREKGGHGLGEVVGRGRGPWFT